jgi:hypothetical protein
MLDSNLPQQSENLKPAGPTHNFMTIKGKFTFKPGKREICMSCKQLWMTKKGFTSTIDEGKGQHCVMTCWGRGGREEKVALLLVINRTRRLSYFITFLPLLYVF